ncbi:hypothetical protein BJ508DRAFT_177529 [Ascobolus immersus RN42]|uniref:Uncharacterized protein n=1 Tax=Ascobolus immersus RN42 TaxID=1160509 RepID=A0A3N4IH88_ASCIM|nr:hypothetical protein BJ508DRAFT_177529 [Ascobolus immersus RN42]
MIQLPYDLRYLIITHLTQDTDLLLRSETVSSPRSNGRSSGPRTPDIFRTLRSLHLTDRTFHSILLTNPHSLRLYQSHARNTFEFPYAFHLLNMWRPHGLTDFARRQLKRYTRFTNPRPLFLGDVDRTLSPTPTHIGPAELRRLHTDRTKLLDTVTWVRQTFGYGDGRLEKLDLLRGYYIALSLARHFVPLPLDLRTTDLKPKQWRSSVGRETCSNQGVFNHLAYLKLPSYDFALLSRTFKDPSARDAFKTYQTPFDLNSWRKDFGAFENVVPLRRKTSVHPQLPNLGGEVEGSNAFYWVRPFRASRLGGRYESGWEEERILLPARIVHALEKAVEGKEEVLWEGEGPWVEVMVPEIMTGGVSNVGSGSGSMVNGVVNGVQGLSIKPAQGGL